MKLFDVISYEGPADALVWKSPITDMNTGSMLVVGKTQEAIFVSEGKVQDVLTEGTHQLDTSNLPLLSNLLKIPYGKKSPFTAQVYYINRLAQLDLKWGTSSVLTLEDPKYGVLVPVRSYGQFGVQVTDSALFYQQLVGTKQLLETDAIVSSFKALILSHISSLITGYLRYEKISILEIPAFLPALSQQMKEALAPFFLEYGIGLMEFHVQSVNIPPEDSSVQELKRALSKKATMSILDYDYKTERTFDTMERAVKNTGTTGQMMGAGMGLGAGLGMGEVFSDLVKETLSSQSKKETPEKQEELPPDGMMFCRHCGQSIVEDSVFCKHCGGAVTEDTTTEK